MPPRRLPLLLGVLALALAIAALVVALTRDQDGQAGVVRVVRVVSSPADDAFSKEQFVLCPHGYLPTGGGGNIPEAGRIPGASIYWSAPYEGGWRVQASDVFRAKKPWTLTAYVVCARGRDAAKLGGSLPPEVVGG